MVIFYVYFSGSFMGLGFLIGLVESTKSKEPLGFWYYAQVFLMSWFGVGCLLGVVAASVDTINKNTEKSIKE